MTIYVDPLFQTPSQKNAAFKVGEKQDHQWCHLYTFPVTEEAIAELHKLAQAIGLKRSWFQEGERTMPHYDLVPSKRDLAIKRGAVEVSTKEAIDHFRTYRVSTRPPNAVERFYLNCKLLTELTTSLLPKAQDNPIELTYPTPENTPLHDKSIPLSWELGIKHKGRFYSRQINAYELAIAASEGNLEPFASRLTNDLVKQFYLPE
jgi:hypothetical protein